MKILNINTESHFSRYFNSLVWVDDFKKIGIETSLIVGDNSFMNYTEVESISNNKSRISLELSRMLNRVQFKLGVQNKFTFHDDEISKSTRYSEADLVHMHVLSPDFLKLKTLDRISQDKPFVWTWHDPSYLTGHCIYPGKCSNWKLNCKSCPDLERGFEVGRDRAFKNRKEKFKRFSKMNFQVHVASEWMKNLIQESDLELKRDPVVIPLPSRFKIIDRLAHRRIFREKYEIKPHDLVIGFRDNNQWQKNIKGVQDLLINLPNKDIVIVSVDQQDILFQFKKKFKVIELGHLNNDTDLKYFFSGIDIFLNLSTDEAYGMMAVESTSLGTPVMAFKNTATFETLKKYGGFPIRSIQEGVSIIRNIMIEPTSMHRKLEKVVKTQNLGEIETEEYVNKMKHLYTKIISEF